MGKLGLLFLFTCGALHVAEYRSVSSCGIGSCCKLTRAAARASISSWHHHRAVCLDADVAWPKTHLQRASALRAAGSASNAVNKLATKISNTEDKLIQLEVSVKAIKTGNQAAMATFGCKKADLDYLVLKEMQLREQLNLLQKEKILLIEQQQQGFAGMWLPLCISSPLYSSAQAMISC